MNNKPNQILQMIPAIDALLQWEIVKKAGSKMAQKYRVALLRSVVSEARELILQRPDQFRTVENVHGLIAEKLEDSFTRLLQPSIRRVINCTGIILHTGLGRAPFSPAAVTNVKKILDGYCNIEFDLYTATRGERVDHVEQLLCLLTGAEAAAIVNNNAAAVLLSLNSLADNREVIISRGELIEIGGSFRIPDVISKSGAIMVEVGTTNKTHLTDFQNAISKKTAGFLAVHTSNFRVSGFTANVALPDAVALAHDNNLFVLHDLGGGILLDFENLGLPGEPLVSESIAAGVDVATFSGDKVIGGPQCGIIVGRKKYLDRIRKNPLMRALRCDKLTYALLESTLKLFIEDDKTAGENMVLQQFTATPEEIKKRAQRVQTAVEKLSLPQIEFSIEAVAAQAGSGTMPLEKLPSYAFVIHGASHTRKLARALRAAQPAVVGYLNQDKLFLDMRSCLPQDIDLLIEILTSKLSDE